jgi:hypothetical protein
MLLCELALVVSAHVKKEIDMTIKMKFPMNMHTQILIKMCSQYKGNFESVVIIQNFCFPGTRDDSNFTEIRLHKIC